MRKTKIVCDYCKKPTEESFKNSETHVVPSAVSTQKHEKHFGGCKFDIFVEVRETTWAGKDNDGKKTDICQTCLIELMQAYIYSLLYPEDG